MATTSKSLKVLTICTIIWSVLLLTTLVGLMVSAFADNEEEAVAHFNMIGAALMGLSSSDLLASIARYIGMAFFITLCLLVVWSIWGLYIAKAGTKIQWFKISTIGLLAYQLGVIVFSFLVLYHLEALSPQLLGMVLFVSLINVGILLLGWFLSRKLETASFSTSITPSSPRS